jgi:hypothetical protein
VKLHTLVFVAACSLLTLFSSPLIADDDRPDQLQVLDRNVGVFDAEMTVKPGLWVPNGSHTNFKYKSEWVLNGRVLKTEGFGKRTQDGKKQKEEFIAMMTYDVNTKKYMGAVFYGVRGGGADYWASDVNSQNESVWDAKTQTMTAFSKDPQTGITYKGVTRWISKDENTWHHVFKDAKGKVLMERTGKAVRREK